MVKIIFFLKFSCIIVLNYYTHIFKPMRYTGLERLT